MWRDHAYDLVVSHSRVETVAAIAVVHLTIYNNKWEQSREYEKVLS
jgi:hypothetical protein